MRFVTLFAVEAAGNRHFVYGNALPDDGGLSAAATWRPFQVTLNEGRTLWRYTRAMSEAAFEDLSERFAFGDALRLEVSNGGPIVMERRPSMIRRPAVRASNIRRVPSPIIGDDERHTVLWSADPRSFMDTLMAAVASTARSRVSDMRTFIARLSRLSTVPFDGGQLWRIGCFETIDSVADAGIRAEDLRIELINEGAPRLRVNIAGALASTAAYLRIYVAGGNDADVAVAVLERVIAYQGDDIEINLPERGSIFEVDVFGGPHGDLLRSHRSTRVQRLAVSTRIVEADEASWLSLVPEEFQRAATTGMSSASFGPGQNDVEVWTAGQAVAAAYEAAYFPARAPGFHLAVAEDQQRALLRAMLAAAGRGRLVIADPYFDVAALEEHFIGRSSISASIEILTSLRDDTSTSARDQISGTQPHSARNRGPSLQSLLDTANRHQNQLPRRMTITNIQSFGAGEQFHDRFVYAEPLQGLSSLWWLGNSLNSLGSRRFPLFVAQVQGSQRLEYADYVRRLGDGEVAQRPDARAVRHWTNRWNFAWPATVAPELPDLREFVGWRRIVSELSRFADIHGDFSSDVAVVSTITALSEAGYLQVYSGRLTWQLPEDRHVAVALFFAETLQASSDDELRLLVEALAHWDAHGGVPGNALSLEHSVVERVLAGASTWVDQQIQAHPDLWSATEGFLEEHIDAAIRRLERNRFTAEGRHPILVFVRDTALHNAAGLYWSFVSVTQRDPVYESVTAWRWPLNYSANAVAVEQGDPVLCAQIVAAYLQNHEPERATLVIRELSLSDEDRSITLTRLLIDDRRAAEVIWPEFSLIWRSVVINHQTADRLAATLDRHHPGATVDLLRNLSNEHPECPSIRETIISRWAQFLAPSTTRNNAAQQILDGYARHVAREAAMANIVAEQFATGSAASQRFADEVMDPLDLHDLDSPFARRSSYESWQDAAHRAARVIAAACRLVLIVDDNTVLPPRISRLVGRLNCQSWGEITYDLLPLNAIFGLAEAAANRPQLDGALAVLIRSANVSPALRLTAIIAAAHGLERFTTELATIELSSAFEHYLPNQRSGILGALTRRLDAVDPDSTFLMNLRELMDRYALSPTSRTN